MRIVVPSRFRTDFTSHPRWLANALVLLVPFLWVWPGLVWVLAAVSMFALLIRDPLGRHQRAAMFHDSGYSDQYAPRHVVDAAYRRIMELDHVNPVRILLHFWAVRLFGGIAWRRNKNR
jgi:hypothetical protein